MARQKRIEVEGGLYHLITRGVDRKDIFHSAEDHHKFLALLSAQKAKLPFYLYAYCLMTNHIHLLIERRTDDVGRIMHRVLTGYTQYYNRKYGRSGHVLQGRHRSILCQTDPYLAELVRYIHLNPVRAKMVSRAEKYPFSSHRAYLGLDPLGPLDVEPILRRFGPRKALARERFADFVDAASHLGSQEGLYRAEQGILGSEEFVDEIIHRIGEFDTKAAAARRRTKAAREEVDLQALLHSVEVVCDVSAEDFCKPAKGTRYIIAKEALILVARELGMSATALSRIMHISVASVSRRHDIAKERVGNGSDLAKITARVHKEYRRGKT